MASNRFLDRYGSGNSNQPLFQPQQTTGNRFIDKYSAPPQQSVAPQVSQAPLQSQAEPQQTKRPGFFQNIANTERKIVGFLARPFVQPAKTLGEVVGAKYAINILNQPFQNLATSKVLLQNAINETEDPKRKKQLQGVLDGIKVKDFQSTISSISPSFNKTNAQIMAEAGESALAFATLGRVGQPLFGGAANAIGGQGAAEITKQSIGGFLKQGLKRSGPVGGGFGALGAVAEGETDAGEIFKRGLFGVAAATVLDAAASKALTAVAARTARNQKAVDAMPDISRKDLADDSSNTLNDIMRGNTERIRKEIDISSDPLKGSMVLSDFREMGVEPIINGKINPKVSPSRISDLQGKLEAFSPGLGAKLTVDPANVSVQDLVKQANRLVDSVAKPAGKAASSSLDFAAGRAGKELVEVGKTGYDILADQSRKILRSPDMVSEASRNAETVAEAIRRQTRGVLSFEKQQKMSQAWGLDYNEYAAIVSAGNEGTPLNTEVLLGAFNTAEKAKSRVLSMLQQVAKNPELRDDLAPVFAQELNNFKASRIAFMGFRAESGRALGVQSSTSAQQKLQKAFQDLIENDEVFTSRNTGKLVDEMLEKGITTDEQLSAELASKLRPGAMDKLVEFSTAIKLTGFVKTNARNILGNAVSLSFKPSEKLVSGIFGRLEAGLRGKTPDRFVGEGAADVVGAFAGIKSGVNRFLSALGNESFLANTQRTQEVARDPAIAGKFGKVVRFPFRLLNAFDQLFSGINESAGIYSQAYREAAKKGYKGAKLLDEASTLVANPTEAMMNAARKESEQYLFKEPLGKVAQTLNSVRNQVPISKLIVPFFRTPINLTKFQFRRSLFGVVSPTNLADLFSKSMGRRSDALARLSIGGALSAATIMQAADGKITWKSPSDPDERAAFFASGKRPFSLKIGDRWVSYKGIEPLGSWFAQAAALQSIWEKKKEDPDLDMVGELVGGFFEHVRDLPYLYGVREIFRAMDNPQSRASQYLAGLAGGATIPVGVSQIAAATDPYVRDPESFLEELAARIPVLREKVVPTLLDVFGDPVVQAEPAASRLLSPVSIIPDEATPLNRELDRLDVIVSFPTKYITPLGETEREELTRDEFRQRLMDRGPVLKQALNYVIGLPTYHALKETDKKTLLEETISAVHTLKTNEFKVKRFFSDHGIELRNDYLQRLLGGGE